MPSARKRVTVRFPDDEIEPFQALKARMQAELKADLSDSDVLRRLVKLACEANGTPARKKGAS